MVSGTRCPYVSVCRCEVVRGAAAPKGPMTFAVFIGQRLQRGRSPVEHRGTFVRHSVSPFVPKGPPRPEICPLSPEIWPHRLEICSLRP